jgi:hypothetical protein
VHAIVGLKHVLGAPDIPDRRRHGSEARTPNKVSSPAQDSALATVADVLDILGVDGLGRRSHLEAVG